jgi:hypothetical protein
MVYRKPIDNALEKTMIKPFNSPAVSTTAATSYNSVCFSFRQEWLPVDNPCQHPFPHALDIFLGPYLAIITAQ